MLDIEALKAQFLARHWRQAGDEHAIPLLNEFAAEVAAALCTEAQPEPESQPEPETADPAVQATSLLTSLGWTWDAESESWLAPEPTEPEPPAMAPDAPAAPAPQPAQQGKKRR